MGYSEEEIKEMFDSNPSLSLERLSQITGLDVEELKYLLLKE